MRRAVMPLALLFVSGCAARPHPVATVTSTAVDEAWRGIATQADQDRIAALPSLWSRARAAVPRAGRARLAAEGALVLPDAALDAPALPPGPYHCRLIRFGGRAGIASFTPDFCYVEVHGATVSFTKQTGENLPQGWLYPDTARRQVFLGTFRNKSGATAKYGTDPAHDVAGLVERVSPFRWRLTLVRSGSTGMLDVYELVPVTPEVPGAKAAVPAS